MRAFIIGLIMMILVGISTLTLVWLIVDQIEIEPYVPPEYLTTTTTR